MQMRMRTTEMVPWNRSLLVLWLFQSLLLVLVLPGPMLHPYPSSMSETVVQAFCPPQQQQRGRPLASVRAAAADALEPDAEGAKNAMQWELFQRHHAVAPNNRIRSSSSSTAAPSTSAANTKTASWKGIWTTYDLMGDAILETVASVDYQHQQPQAQQQQQPSIAVSHTIVTGTSSTLSDCETCFDSDVMETTTIPVATYTPSTLEPSRVRLGACGMIVGPSLMRSSGSMATELVLSHGNGRVRVIFQHAPVWEKSVEPGSCPPQGLKLFRCMVSREKLQQQHQVESSSTGANDADNDLVSESGGGPPTAESERLHPPTAGNPTFYRTVPPFDWHKKWGGTSWTWGPEAGHRGWSIAELKTETADDSGNYNDDDDDWHGRAPVEVWNLRLPGGIFVQTARVIQSNVAEACRLAWLPDSDTLLRLEARVLALQPIFETSNDDDGELVGFEPPVLASMRCDVLQNLGDLEGAPSFVQQMQEEIKDEVQTNGETGTTKSAIVLPSATEKIGDHSPKRHQYQSRRAIY